MNTNDPNEALARAIVDRLISARLLRAGQRDRLLRLLAEGALKESDWRAALETALQARTTESDTESGLVS